MHAISSLLRSRETYSAGLGGAFAPLRALGALGGAGDEGGVDLLEDRVLVDHALADVLAGREVVHDVEQDLLHDRPEASGTGAPQHRQVGDGGQGVLGERELDTVV